ncbi:MAG: response regulator [Candidatus Sulfotelmatobacter sp.]|nr:response regulator [Candidatus Sulfotelmatobacter sp.]
MILGWESGMTLSTLLVCSDAAAVDVLRRVVEKLEMKVELCADPVRAAVRLAQERFDLIVLDCKTQRETIALLLESRSSRLNDSTLAVVVVQGQENIREMFSLGVNFVVYKPIAYERALSSLRAAQTLLYRDKRRKARAIVHTQATVDYAGGEQVRATLVDLAEDGMAVTFGKKLPPTSKVYFQFQLPGHKSTIRLSGQVVWQDWNGRAGVQFVDVPQTSRRIISEWLQKNLDDAVSDELASQEVGVRQSIQPQGVSTAGAQTEKQAGKSREREAVARLRSEPDNRRGQTRYSCRLGAEVFQAGSSVRNYCHLSDLSPGGCYLEMPLVFAQGSAIEITVRTHEMKLRLSGQVKASHPGYGMGISFKLNTKDERAGVQQLIDFVATATPSSE